MAETTIDVEGNFLDLYMQAVGRTEVPDQFHLWTALSLIAACLEDRVWMERMAYKRLFPNQYIFLIGDPASGKGTAIGLGKRILDDMERRQYGINYHRGALTRAGLQDELESRWEEAQKRYHDAQEEGRFAREPTGVGLFFLAPELGSNASIGAQAKDLIKFLTDLWEGDTGTYRERTRLHGKHEFQNPFLNCLVGSAPAWCREVVDTNDLQSGFWARVACVRGERDYDQRIYDPDTRLWARLLPVLSWRLSLLTRRVHEKDVECYGAMVYDRAARALDKAWYEGRRKPEDGLFAAHWSRLPDQVAKIAMLLRLCDFWDFARPREDWRVIEERHWAQARALSEQLLLNAGTFLGQSLSHAHNWQMAKVEETIRGRQMIRQKPELLRIVSRYGIKAKELEKALQALEDEERVSRWPQGGGNYMVEWREGGEEA